LLLSWLAHDFQQNAAVVTQNLSLVVQAFGKKTLSAIPALLFLGNLQNVNESKHKSSVKINHSLMLKNASVVNKV
jgi:hypothetical protein